MPRVDAFARAGNGGLDSVCRLRVLIFQSRESVSELVNSDFSFKVFSFRQLLGSVDNRKP